MSSGVHITTWSGAIEQTSGDIIWGDFGVIVGLFIPSISSTASTNGITINVDTPLPSNLRPSVQRNVSGYAISDGTRVDAIFTIGTDGSIAVSTDGRFASSGNNGLPFQGISYSK